MTISSSRRGLLLISPAFLMMLTITGYPLIHAFWLSMHNTTLVDSYPGDFVGMTNYGTVLLDYYWWHALVLTIVITIISVSIEFILGFALALAMHHSPLARNTLRTSVLIPYGIVTVVAAYSWYYAWAPGIGYLTHFLPKDFAPLTHTYWALLIVVIAEVWKTTPFMALLLLAGLSLVPADLLKAARMDGASNIYQFIHIVMPIMKSAMGVAILLRSLDAFRIFDSIYVLTGGQNKTQSISILGYDNLFKGFNLGLGSTISLLIFVCATFIALVCIGMFSPTLETSNTND